MEEALEESSQRLLSEGKSKSLSSYGRPLVIATECMLHSRSNCGKLT